MCVKMAAAPAVGPLAVSESERRQRALEDYRKRMIEHRELDTKLKKMHEELKELTKEFDKSEEDLKALQSGVNVFLYGDNPSWV